MIVAGPSGQLYARAVPDPMLVEKGPHILPKERGDPRLRHDEHVVQRQHRLNKGMNPMAQIARRRLDLQLTTIELYAEAAQRSFQNGLAFRGVQLQSAFPQVREDIAVVRKDDL